MQYEIKHKLDIISKIWNHFIWDYKLCNNKIKFTDDVKSNYFGDILGYFGDTFEIVFEPKESSTFSDKFAYNISLLQAVYIHQDFIEELLNIFKCGVDKGMLLQDENYSLNREIRNELIGHPIRKKRIPTEIISTRKCLDCGNSVERKKMKSTLLSSTTFGYEKEQDKITYLRYHIDNHYKFEKRSFRITEIQQRHSKFLNFYFDKIIEVLKQILEEFIVHVKRLESKFEKLNFNSLLDMLSYSFESIFESDILYSKENLIEVYGRRTEHKRYQNLIDSFYKNLKSNLSDTISFSQELFDPIRPPVLRERKEPKTKIVFKKNGDSNTGNLKETYNYELAKLLTKRNPWDFDFFSELLRSKCEDNLLVIEELDHMKSNLTNDIEYFCSYKLIYSELTN